MSEKPARKQKLIYVKLFLAFFTGLVVALIVYIETSIALGNLHVVSPGKFYRSAQMNGEGFRHVIEKEGIKTIINLRGPNATDWYQSETNIAQQLNVRHFDFPLSASQQLDVPLMDQIVETLRAAPKPILIHCKNGADRSGLVSALYLYTLEGKSVATADEQLSIRCGHFPYLFWRNTAAMDDSFRRYVNSHDQATNHTNAKPESDATTRGTPAQAGAGAVQ